MKLLYAYLKKHKLLLFLALLMAAINICFSLSDSVITGKLMQDCGVGISKYKGNEIGFIKSVAFWLGLSLGAAMISRITKNFQDYFTNIVIQRTGAEMYTDGIKKSLDLPYEEFEDQRSGETLSKLTKVRSDSEKLITLSISLIFQTVIGFIFVIVYVSRIDYRISFIFLISNEIFLNRFPALRLFTFNTELPECEGTDFSGKALPNPAPVMASTRELWFSADGRDVRTR